MRDATSRSSGGFTLLELLVVIGILSVLAAVLVPNLMPALTSGDETVTRARQQGLVAMIDSYENAFGAVPPDDFSLVSKSMQKDWVLTADKVNSGIESLVIHLSWEPKAGGALDEYADWLQNTDGDKNAAPIPMLERTAKVEVVDAWGTPFAYFSARVGSRYAGTQTIQLAEIEGQDGERIRAKPFKNPESSGYLSPRGFQLISAGADLKFNTDDDIVWPEAP